MESVVADLNPLTADGIHMSGKHQIVREKVQNLAVFFPVSWLKGMLLETLVHQCERCVTEFQLSRGGLRRFSTAATPQKQRRVPNV